MKVKRGYHVVCLQDAVAPNAGKGIKQGEVYQVRATKTFRYRDLGYNVRSKGKAYRLDGYFGWYHESFFKANENPLGVLFDRINAVS